VKESSCNQPKPTDLGASRGTEEGVEELGRGGRGGGGEDAVDYGGDGVGGEGAEAALEGGDRTLGRRRHGGGGVGVAERQGRGTTKNPTTPITKRGKEGAHFSSKERPVTCGLFPWASAQEPHRPAVFRRITMHISS